LLANPANPDGYVIIPIIGRSFNYYYFF